MFIQLYEELEMVTNKYDWFSSTGVTMSLLLTLFFEGCSPKPPVSAVIEPCESALSVDHDKHSFAAVLLALERRNWTLEHVDKEKKTIIASACVIGSSDCAWMFFSVHNARVHVTESPIHPFDPKMRNDIERWLGFLRPVYSHYSCQTDRSLRESIWKYGISF